MDKKLIQTKNPSLSYCWFFMALAIVSEVAGVIMMKYGATKAPVLGLSAMYILLIVSYLSLAMAVRRIPLVVAYGTWESLGLVLIFFFSVLLFDEAWNLIKIIGVSSIITGIFLLEIGTEEASTTVRAE